MAGMFQANRSFTAIEDLSLRRAFFSSQKAQYSSIRSLMSLSTNSPPVVRGPEPIAVTSALVLYWTAPFISACMTFPASPASLKSSSNRSTCSRVSNVTSATFPVFGMTATVTFGISFSSSDVRSSRGEVECTPPVTAQTKSYRGIPALTSASVVALMHACSSPPSCCSTWMKMSICERGYRLV
jgi:hypothetical protein